MKKRHVGRPPAGPNGTRVRDLPQLSVRLPRPVLREFNRGRIGLNMTHSEFLEHLLRAWRRA